MRPLDRLRAIVTAHRKREGATDIEPALRLEIGAEPASRGDGPVPREWLKGIVGVEEVDSWLLELATQSGRTVDDVSGAWPALRARMVPGDEAWFFSSDAESWRHLAGREGYALVRGGEAIDSWITRKN